MDNDMMSMIESGDLQRSSVTATRTTDEREFSSYSNDEFDEVNVNIEPKPKRKGSYFDGKFLPYLAYKSLCTSLKATGVGNAWGETSWAYYKYNHTVYNGKRIKFEGKGIDLFPEIFKWTLFTAFTFGIYALWIPVRKEQWLVSKMHFEDEEYVEGYSFFDGFVLGLIGVNLFSYFLSTISGGLLLPVAYCYKKKWYAKHTVISRKRLIFEGSVAGLYGNYLKWWFLSIITLGIYALWIPINLVKWETKNTRIKTKADHYKPTSKVPMVIGIIGGILFIALAIFLYANMVFGVRRHDSKIENQRIYERVNRNYYDDYYDDYDY